MTRLCWSREGGPGGSVPLSLMLHIWEAAKKVGSRKDVPVGSMETGDAGGLAPAAGTQRGAAPAGTGKRCPADRRLAAGSLSRLGQSRATSAAASHRRGHRGESGNRRRLRKAREPGAAAGPGPFPAWGGVGAETPPGGAAWERNSPRVRVNRVFHAEALYLPGRSVWAACLGWRRRRGDGSRCSTHCFTLIRALGNNFPPRARQTRKWQ
jgi:hypothetical protein